MFVGTYIIKIHKVRHCLEFEEFTQNKFFKLLGICSAQTLLELCGQLGLLQSQYRLLHYAILISQTGLVIFFSTYLM